eukprot:Selendium_serpulae@DN6124_c0_g1_i5.p1
MKRLCASVQSGRLKLIILCLALCWAVSFYTLNQSYAGRQSGASTPSQTNDDYGANPQFIQKRARSLSKETTGHLYLWVEGYNEGLASWMISISQLLIYAKTYNATYVEPCIHNGKLRSCYIPEEEDSPIATRTLDPEEMVFDTVRLSDVFDIEKLKSFYPNIISHEEFYNATRGNNTIWYKTCHKTTMNTTGVNTTCYGTAKSVALDAAIDSSRAGAITVAQFERYGRSLWGRSHFADELKKENNYSVIQWRGEIHKLDYMTCAKQVVEVKDFFVKTEGDIPFFIMTSLHKNETLAWSDRSTGTTAQEALSLLVDDNGFLKLEILMAEQGVKVKDKILHAIYDLILAAKGRQFITCMYSCQGNFCQKCSWSNSQFAFLATLIRTRDYDKDTVKCWPENLNDSTVNPVASAVSNHYS